jgi:NAD(P)-dependent dehydrogenase (short-subunit alcohol dehydrogenase family)
MQIKDRTFLISGGSSGLGLATALLLLSHSANISNLDVQPPVESHAVLSDPDRVLFTKTDVTSTSSLEAAVKATIAWCQKTGKPLSGVICSAGVGSAALILPKQKPGTTHESVQYMPMAAFDRTIAINLRGTVDLMRLTIPHMALNEPWGPDGERGIAVVVSSVAAYEGQVGQLAYSASKGAVRSIVLPLAREVGQKAGIRVLGVAPGMFHTGMTAPPKKKEGPTNVKLGGDGKVKAPSGERAGMNKEMLGYPTRLGKGEEFAGLIKQMIENPMLNGVVVRLDGGVRMPTRL